MMEAGWSARRVARQLGCSDCVVRRCWDQWNREMSFTRREDRNIVRNARVQPTASTTAIQAPITYAALDAHPSKASFWSDATHEETGLQRNGTRSSLATNPDSILAVMVIVFVCEDPVVNASILPLLYSVTPLPQLV
ncbi:uncharacterized protein TNCV_3627601 [Trichonephila clavipes]|nr:uncharacterized protein TNCV_3627601 [Trichonephila clavipes]